jgi:hypothetical protein
VRGKKGMLNKSNKTTKIAQKLGIFFVSFGLALSLSLSAYAASLTLEEKRIPTEISDFSVLVTLAVSDADDVASLDFTLTYDAEKMILNSITPTLHLQASGKILETNEDVIGTVKGIIYGLNKTEIASGNLFQLNFSKVNGAQEGIVAVAISDVNIASITAMSTNSSIINNAISLEGEAQNKLASNVPTITNTATLLNQDHFVLNWTNESASGATSYVVKQMKEPVSPLALANGLVSYWPMNEASGEAVDVVSGNNLQTTGSIVGSADIPLGIISGSRDFIKGSTLKSINEYVKNFNFAATGQMTWAGWVKANNLYENNMIINKINADGSFYSLSATSAGALKAEISVDGKSSFIMQSINGLISTGIWQHIALSAIVGGGNPFIDTTKIHPVSLLSKMLVSKTSSNVSPEVGSFDGSSGLRVDNAADLNVFASATTDNTVDFWFKRSKDPKVANYYLTQCIDGNNFWAIREHNSLGGIHIEMQMGGAVKAPRSSYKLTGNYNWHHLALVKKGTVLALYLDGKQITYTTCTAQKFLTGPLYVGYAPYDATGNFTGCMDELRISEGNIFSANPNSAKSSIIKVPTAPNKATDQTKMLIPFGLQNEVGLFVNGQNVSQELKEIPSVPVAAPAAFFGIGSDNLNNPFSGKIAQSGFWNRILNTTEIQALSFVNEKTYTVNTNLCEPTDIIDGRHLYCVQSVSGEGAGSDYSKVYTVDVDTTPPVMPSITTQKNAFALKNIAIQGTCSSDTTQLSIVSDKAVISNKVFNGTAWSADISVIDDGQYQVSVIAEDAAGNLSQIATKSFFVDTKAPVITFITPASETYTVPRKNVYLVGAIDEKDIVTISCHYSTLLGNGDITAPVTNGNFSFGYVLQKGLNALTVKAIDKAGNQTLKEYSITYRNNLPLVFDGLQNKSTGIDEKLAFLVNITYQNDIDPELLSFTASNLPCAGSKNPATFNAQTRQLSWTPNSSQTGLYTVNFSVTDGSITTSKAIKIVVRDYDINVIDLSEIVSLPQDKQVVVEDFDKDGNEDIFMVAHGINKFYRNLGDGTFVEEASNIGFSNETGLANAAIVLDINEDNWSDIYVVNDGANKLFVNNQDGTFSDMTTEYGIGDIGYGRDAIFEDLNGDTAKDLYVANDGQNTLYINNGDGTFDDATKASGLDDMGAAVSLCVFDADSDKDLDIFIVNDGDIAYYINNGDGTFLNARSKVSGPTSFTGYRGTVRDVNYDGVADVYLVNTSKNIVYLCDGNGNLKAALLNKVSLSPAVHSKSAFYIDYNNDGNLDLFIVDSTSKYIEGMGNILFQNDGGGSYTDVTAIAELI